MQHNLAYSASDLRTSLKALLACFAASLQQEACIVFGPDDFPAAPPLVHPTLCVRVLESHKAWGQGQERRASQSAR